MYDIVVKRSRSLSHLLMSSCHTSGSIKNNSHFWHSDWHNGRLGKRWVCGNRW